MSSPSDRSGALTIAIVEDEPDIADLLALYCRREGWHTVMAADADRALEVIADHQPDVVLLDVGLSGVRDGFDVCRKVRATSNVPILFLTARDDEIDRILGLELGGDDYVTKPFSPREVMARIKAILRRGAPPNSPVDRIDFDSIRVDLVRREATVDGAAVSLASQEFALLQHLVEHLGQALSRDQILRAAWGEDWFGDTRTVDVHIRQLRKKLGDDLPLATVRGVGYRLG